MTATPIHDQLVLWLDQNIAEVLPMVAEQIPALMADRGDRWYRPAHDPKLKECLARMSVTRKVWEQPVLDRPGPRQNRNVVIKGYIDLAVEVDLLKLVLVNDWRERDSLTLAFEIKPRIASLGELIRQIRMYQTFTGNYLFFVASPDQRYAALLREQGIGFIPLGPAQGGLLDA